MDKVFIQEIQDKAEKLAPSNNTSFRTENICFCGFQDILRIVCLDVFSFYMGTAGKAQLLAH